MALVHYSNSSLHKEICVINVAATLLFLGFTTHLDHINLYRIQSVLKMYSRLFLVQTTSRLVYPLVPIALRRLNYSLFLLVGLRKYVQRLISLWKHINGLRLLLCMYFVQLTSGITYLLQCIISMINCSVPTSNFLPPLGVKPCRK